MRKQTPRRYREEFCARLKGIRQSAGYSQPEFARLLGVHPDTYPKYESRSLLPHHLIPKVCEVTGHDPWFVLTGNPPPDRAA